MEKERDLLRMITVALKKRKAAGIIVKEEKKVIIIAIPSINDTRI